MIFTTGLLIFHIRMVVNNLTTKEELKKFFTNPYGNPYQRSKSFNFLSIIFPKRAKMSLVDILKYNKKMFNEQKKYYKEKIKEKNKVKNEIINNDKKSDEGIKEKILKENEIKIDIPEDNETNNIDSREHFEISNNNEDDNDNNEKVKKKEKTIYGIRKGINISDKSLNQKSSSRDTMIENGKVINKNDKSLNSISSEYPNFDVEESQSYIPGVIGDIDINNNQEFHLSPLIKEDSSQKENSHKEKEIYLKRKNCFKENEEN